MHDDSEMNLDESVIINRFYFEALKEHFNCPICLCLINNPLMCSYCETTFCKKCITVWMTKNDTCPMRCPKQTSTICEINRTIKKNLDGLRLRCKYGCEVPFLSYNKHVNHFHRDDVKCWNCEKVSNKNSIKLLEEDSLESRKKINELLKSVTQKDDQIKSLRNDVTTKNKEILDLRLKISNIIETKNKEKENETLILKAKVEDLEAALKQKENELLPLREKVDESKQNLKPKKGEINQLKAKIDDYEEALKLYFSLDILRDQIKTSEILIRKLKELMENPEKKNEGTNSLYADINLQNIEDNLEDLRSHEVEIKGSLVKLVKNKTSLSGLKYDRQVSHIDESDRKVEKIQTTFKNVKKVNTKDYQFCNENKTIKKMRDNRVGIYCTDKVKLEGIQEFCVRINSLCSDKKAFHSNSVFIYIGFTVFGTCHVDAFHKTKSSWMCCLSTGAFVNAGENLNQSFIDDGDEWMKPSEGDSFSICFDTENDELFLKKNGKIISPSLKMVINKKQKKNIYPCLDVLMTGITITIEDSTGGKIEEYS